MFLRRRARDSNPQPLAGHLISSQAATPESPEENAHSRDSAGPGAAVDPENGPTDPDLRFIVERWDELSEPFKAGILAMVRAADESVIAHFPGKKLQ